MLPVDVGGIQTPSRQDRLVCLPGLALDRARSEPRTQMSSYRIPPKHKEEEKRARGKRYHLILKARGGDPEAIAELREEHSITKVWTQEEIAAYEDNA